MLFKEEASGITWRSAQYLDKCLKKVVGEVIIIEGRIDDTGDQWVVFLTEKDSIMINGFSWGYSGEGPRGLFEAAQKLGFTQLTRDAIASIPMTKRWEIRKANIWVHD